MSRVNASVDQDSIVDLRSVKKSSRQAKNRRKADADKGSLSRALKRLEVGSSRKKSGVKVKIKYN